MITIQLKVKHFYAISDILFDTVASSSFEVLQKIKVACNNLNDNDLTSVDVNVSHFFEIFLALSKKPEGSYNMINTEMMDLLKPQIIAGINNNDPEWILLNEGVTNIRNNNWQLLDLSIINAKNKLYN